MRTEDVRLSSVGAIGSGLGEQVFLSVGGESQAE